MGLVFGVYFRAAKDQGHNQAPRVIIGLDDLDQTINEIDSAVAAYQGWKEKKKNLQGAIWVKPWLEGWYKTVAGVSS